MSRTASGASWNRVRQAVLDALAHTDGSQPMERVCRVCVEMLPVDGASVSISGGARQREVLFASDEVSARLESAQFTLGEGPCFEAFETHRPVLVPDLAETVVSWPLFAAEIAELPVAAVFAFPIQQGAISVGALDMYRRTPGWFTADELTAALVLVDAAGAALLGLHTTGVDGETDADTGDTGGDDQWLAELPCGQVEVHQATGMLLAQLGVPAADALARLRAYAFTTGRPIESVAGEILDGSLRFDDRPA